MKMKHTPGPWPRIQGIDHTAATVSTESGITVATVYGHDLETTKANARLIAAAPELLDELIEQDKFLGVLAGTVPLSEKDTHRRIAMHRESVRAAITKATSRE